MQIIKFEGKIKGMRKSNAIYDMISLVRLGVITCEDLTDFSENLQQAVKYMVERFEE